jgi:hypothetical protein
MEAWSSTETLVRFYQTACCHIPRDCSGQPVLRTSTLASSYGLLPVPSEETKYGCRNDGRLVVSSLSANCWHARFVVCGLQQDSFLALRSPSLSNCQARFSSYTFVLRKCWSLKMPFAQGRIWHTGYSYVLACCISWAETSRVHVMAKLCTVIMCCRSIDEWIVYQLCRLFSVNGLSLWAGQLGGGRGGEWDIFALLECYAA